MLKCVPYPPPFYHLINTPLEHSHEKQIRHPKCEIVPPSVSKIGEMVALRPISRSESCCINSYFSRLSYPFSSRISAFPASDVVEHDRENGSVQKVFRFVPGFRLSTTTGYLGTSSMDSCQVLGVLCVGFALTGRTFQHVTRSQFQKQITLPFSDHCPMIPPQLLYCCVTLPSVSRMPMQLVLMNDHQICRARDLMLPLNLSNIWQNRRLEMNEFAFTGFVSDMTKMSTIRNAWKITCSVPV